MSEEPIRTPYLKWRGGRPRWEPGPHLRRIGIAGRDLKQADGAWMSAQEAVAAAQTMNRELGVRTLSAGQLGNYGDDVLQEIARRNLIRRGASQPPRRLKHGQYVYVFTFDGRWAKIGYSTSPFKRWVALSRGLPHPLQAAIIAPGTLADEAALHRIFAPFRTHFEWFRLSGDLAIWLLNKRPSVGNFRLVGN